MTISDYIGSGYFWFLVVTITIVLVVLSIIEWRDRKRS